MLLVLVVHELAAHSCGNHSICEYNRVVAMAIAALVGATVWCITDVDLSKADLELWSGRLSLQAKVILCNPCQ